MLEKDYLNTNQVVSESEQKEKGKGSKLEGNVTLREVIAMLNDGQSIKIVAKQLGLETRTLKNKLASAAIIQENEMNWGYQGENETDSLSRNVYSKITIKEYDRHVVEVNSMKVMKQSKTTEEIDELDYILYKRAVHYKSTAIKKSLALDEELFCKVKAIADNNGPTIGGVLSALVEKGLEYYNH